MADVGFQHFKPFIRTLLKLLQVVDRWHGCFCCAHAACQQHTSAEQYNLSQNCHLFTITALTLGILSCRNTAVSHK